MVRRNENTGAPGGAVGLAVGVLTELGVSGPVPLVFNAPALADQAQQDLALCGCW
jgi:hypothetical protein